MGFFDRLRNRAQPPRGGRLEITVFGDTQISRAFQSGAGRLRDMRPAYHDILDWLLEYNKTRFDEEGPGWSALKPSTQAQRKRLGIGPASPILDRTGAFYDDHDGGDLMRSMTVKGDDNQKVTITKKKFDFESLVEYGPYLQRGGRRPFDIAAADRGVPLRIIQEHVFKGRGR